MLYQIQIFYSALNISAEGTKIECIEHINPLTGGADRLLNFSQRDAFWIHKYRAQSEFTLFAVNLYLFWTFFNYYSGHLCIYFWWLIVWGCVLYFLDYLVCNCSSRDEDQSSSKPVGSPVKTKAFFHQHPVLYVL